MQEQNTIFIKGARDNNLKNIDLEIPKNQLVVFTGLSGSGKTTLAFDTIFKEGQRRYIESLSSYARQFLGNIEKPDVDAIEGLSPAISIDQKTTSHNPRSTVGTVTEIYDYLRLLFARVGVPYCPNHNLPIVSFSPTKMRDIALGYPNGTKLYILAPIVKDEKGMHLDTLKRIKEQGFERVRIDGKIMRLSEVEPLEKNIRHHIDIVVDRLIIKEDIASRLFESIELALDYGHGYLIFLSDIEERLLSEHHACPICGFSVPKLEPRLFSFNAPMGYCPSCKGLGIKREASSDILVPNEDLSIDQGAIRWFKNTVNTSNLEWQEFKYLLDQYHIPTNIPFKEYSKKERNIIFHGSDRRFKYVLTSSSGNKMHRSGYIEGILDKITRLYNETNSEMMRQLYGFYMRDNECQMCHGARLSKEVLAIKVNGLNIYEVTCLSIDKLVTFIKDLDNILTDYQKQIVHLLIKEILNRAEFLVDVGLSYLSLARMAATLSGGEAQRIRLATQIGSKLSGILYVLDEPSIGLHQRDNARLIKTMKEMRDLGNTLIVVEHDEEMMLEADYLVDIGPGAGVHGGEVVAQGSLKDLINEPRSITGKYLSHQLDIALPAARRKGNGKFLALTGAECNNLKNIDIELPLGTLILITGVSGSGKSSLINQTLVPALLEKINKKGEYHPGKYQSLSGYKNIDKVVNVTQEPIGKTPRSNPATYVGVFDDIRALFAETPLARAKGYDKGRFSFNVPGGRCEHCQGAGVSRISMNFLPDVYVKCDECDGKRYNDETLEITYKGKNIYEILEMTIEDARDFFANRVQIKRKLDTLYDVGLGYMKLGQQATTLSGGEAQRVKLAYELQKRPTGKTLFVLDEPTTGLHKDDIKRLMIVLERIVDNGDTVLIIEHNLDVIKLADYIIDLGPEGGDGGGQIIALGTPEEVAKNPNSFTGQYLREYLNANCYLKKS